MEAPERELLHRLARLCGILEGYHDIWGEYHPSSPETLREILRAMGLRISSPQDLRDEIALREGAARECLLEPLHMFHRGEKQTLQLIIPAEEEAWKVAAREHGRQLSLGALVRPEIPGAAEDIANRIRASATLEPPLELGTHDIELVLRAPAAAHAGSTRVAVVPDRGFEPEALRRGNRLWGVNIALYGLQSSRSWGIGDFQDLYRATEWVAELGADFVGLLPLHALFNELPSGVSPYYPSSRLFLNPVYIAVELVAEARHPDVEAFLERPSTRREKDRLRSSGLVDPAGAWALKRRTLEMCHRALVRDDTESSSTRRRAFETWRRGQGPALVDFATFGAIREHLANREGCPRPWQEWPPALRRPDAAGPEEFRQAHGAEVEFHAYLQWLAHEQLVRVRERSRELGMALGVYLDQALGVDPSGADAWMHQDVLALQASAGAPPDPFSLLGQRWGVPPPVPERHRRTGYRYFVETLRQNAAQADALRIDHVLALWRLFWIPSTLPASKGAYVAERPGELLGLVKLISQEERCVIVGEDLGTIPPEVSDALGEAGLYSYRLLIFEKAADGRYRTPQEYPRQALVSVTTHDLPTLDGFWQGRDLETKKRLGRYPDHDAAARDAEARRWDRMRLLERLRDEGLLPEGMEPAHEVPSGRLDELAGAVHALLARTPSALLLVNLDDLVGEGEMQNLPGTVDEHPNWRRKCSVLLEELGRLTRARHIADAIRREGRGNRS